MIGLSVRVQVCKVTSVVSDSMTLWTVDCQSPTLADGFFPQARLGKPIAELYSTLCNPMDCSLLGFYVQGILQARILEWVAVPSSRGSSRPRDQIWVSCIADSFFTVWGTRKPLNLSSFSLFFSQLWLDFFAFDRKTGNWTLIMKRNSILIERRTIKLQ